MGPVPHKCALSHAAELHLKAISRTIDDFTSGETENESRHYSNQHRRAVGGSNRANRPTGGIIGLRVSLDFRARDCAGELRLQIPLQQIRQHGRSAGNQLCRPPDRPIRHRGLHQDSASGHGCEHSLPSKPHLHGQAGRQPGLYVQRKIHAGRRYRLAAGRVRCLRSTLRAPWRAF